VHLAAFDHRLITRMTAVLALLVALVAGADPAVSQTGRSQPSPGLQEQALPPPSPLPSSPPPPSSAAAEPPPSAHDDNPGLLHEMGKLFDKILPLKKTGDAGVDRPPEAAPAGSSNTLRDTGETLSRLATPSTMVSGRSICPISATRTPDCKAGADKLCQGKGYKEGKSLNTDAAESCSPKVLIPGRARKPDDCRTDTYVTSALCQ
jgi:hypothetical protein